MTWLCSCFTLSGWPNRLQWICGYDAERKCRFRYKQDKGWHWF